MNYDDLNRLMKERMQAVQAYVEGSDIKDIMGMEAVKHFKGSFDNEGFTDEQVEPWAEVSRRKPSSPWYGHNGFAPTQKKTLKKGDTTLVGKFSQARATAKILHGKTSELRDGIYYEATEKGVKIISPTEYGRVHQFGLQSKIYGKGTFIQKARPFMGKSKVLKANIESIINSEIIKILSK